MKRRSGRFPLSLLSLASSLVLAGPSPSGQAPAATSPPAELHYSTEVPFTSCDDGLVCIAVPVENGRSLTFVIDTGNVASYIAAEAAQELGWPLRALTNKDGTPIEGLQRTDEQTLHAGSAALNIRMLAFPRARMGAPNHKVVFDGGIVFTVLKDRALQIDYPHLVLRLTDVLTDTQDSPLPGTLSTVRFGAQGPAILTGAPFLLNGQALQAQIDTCFTGTMVIYDAALEQLHLGAIAGKGKPRYFPNTDGGVTMLGNRAESIGFGGHGLGDIRPMIYFPTKGVHQ